MKGVQKSILIMTLAFWCQPRCLSQGFQIDPSILDGEGGYHHKWDPVEERLILYRDMTDSRGAAARLFNSDGTNLAVYPLRDLAESRYIDIWGAAATPQGGMVLTAIVGYSPRAVKPPQIKSLLLTYDGAGKLIKVWDVDPHHHHLLAVDRNGNVFALGDGNLNEPYPLVVKYSPRGTVLRAFLPTSTFPDGDLAISNNSPNGEPDMFIRGDQLFVWIAKSQDLFRFSLVGDLLGRTSLATALNKLASTPGSE